MKKLLIMDDDEDFTAILKIFLTKAGFAVKVTADEIRFLDLIEEFSTDLVMIDLHLSKEKGLEILEKIRQVQKWKQLPFIVISSVFSENEVENISKLDRCRFWNKVDSSLEDLLAIVKMQLCL